jgi:ABC-2 type transport system permease protein
MMVMARQAEDPLVYVLFPAFFLAFIPIPGAMGLVLAWMAARFLPRRVARRASMIVGGAIVIAGLWGLQSLSLVDAASETWLRSFLTKMSFVEWAFLPNYWVATGIDHAVARHTSEAFLYLGVTAANALFLSWLGVRLVSGYFNKAYDRAAAGRGGEARETAEASGGFPGLAFAYLPLPLRLIAAKDLRTFFRDPLQWSQLVILFGLLALYLINMPTWRLQFGGGGQILIMPFLNLCAISLIIATFTCRFVFPLISLEGNKLWLIRLLPMPIRRILLAKFAFAMTVTLLVAVSAMGLAAYRLQLSPAWVAIHLGVTAAICFGLCGFAVGIGARMPMFGESNAARIANGLGGTTNLLASVSLVASILVCVGVATWRSRNLSSDAAPDNTAILLCLAGMFAGVAAGALALRWGGKHLDTIEV